MKLNKITKHEHCEVGVLECVQGPHTGKLVCIDKYCNRKRKFIKWVSLNEYKSIKILEQTT